jgi:hypothetical protein
MRRTAFVLMPSRHSNALFPKTPVGIARLSNGHKVLIFPQPGDEKRFITHL